MTSYPVIFGFSDPYQKDCKGRAPCVSDVGLSLLQFICVFTGELFSFGKSVLAQKVCLGQDICFYQRIWKGRRQVGAKQSAQVNGISGT